MRCLYATKIVLARYSSSGFPKVLYSKGFIQIDSAAIRIVLALHEQRTKELVAQRVRRAVENSSMGVAKGRRFPVIPVSKLPVTSTGADA
jgi:hypothetical protein